MTEIIKNMVKQEKIAWVTVVFSLAIAAYYFLNAPLALQIADLHSGEMRRIMSVCFVLIVASEILVGMVSKSKSGITDEDERDDRIRDKAVSIAHYTMLGLLILLIGQIVFFQGLNRSNEENLLGELGVANVLLGILILSSVSQQFAKIYYYRKGY